MKTFLLCAALLGAGLEQKAVETLFGEDLCGELTGTGTSH